MYKQIINWELLSLCNARIEILLCINACYNERQWKPRVITSYQTLLYHEIHDVDRQSDGQKSSNGYLALSYCYAWSSLVTKDSTVHIHGDNVDDVS